MRKATRISLALGTSAALLSLCAVPASAADSVAPWDPADPKTPAQVKTTTTVDVPIGSLSIGVGADLGAVDFEFDETIGKGKTVTVDVPQVTVTDLRAGELEWSVSVEMSTFESDEKVIETSEAIYSIPNSLASQGNAQVAFTGGIQGSTVQSAVVNASDVKGNNMASWNAAVAVMVPSDALAGTYTATLTHSLL